MVHSALERTLGLEKENREERCNERQFQTEKSWLREHALDRESCMAMTRPHNHKKHCDCMQSFPYVHILSEPCMRVSWDAEER